MPLHTSPSPPLSPGASDASNPHINIPSASLPSRPQRSRSVQFSMSTSPKSRPRDQDNAVWQQAESSADEVTPIAGRESGGSKSYETSHKRSESEPRGGSKDRRTSVRRRTSRSSRQSGEGHEDAGGWWRDFVDKYGSIELDNKGSVARDHLALERTFLAWLRTSLAFASIGIAITQLFRLNTTIQARRGQTSENSDSAARLRHLGKPLGATFLGIAILVLIVGGRRYFESQYWIVRGKFPASRGSIFLVTGITAALIITSLVIVIVISPTVFEK